MNIDESCWAREPEKHVKENRVKEFLTRPAKGVRQPARNDGLILAILAPGPLWPVRFTAITIRIDDQNYLYLYAIDDQNYLLLSIKTL